jgi:hypothetical protein
MRSESDVRETLEEVREMAEELDEEGQHAQAIGPAILVEGFEWVLEEESEDNPLPKLES